MEGINKAFEKMDHYLGPSKAKHGRACQEDREMLMECVLTSKCFQENENFKYCIREGVDKECKALRYNYYLCRRSQVFWEKSFSRDSPRWELTNILYQFWCFEGCSFIVEISILVIEWMFIILVRLADLRDDACSTQASGLSGMPASAIATVNSKLPNQ